MKIRFTKLVKQAMAGKITRKKSIIRVIGGGEMVRLSSPLCAFYFGGALC